MWCLGLIIPQSFKITQISSQCNNLTIIFGYITMNVRILLSSQVIRSICKSWKDVVDASVEFAALRLSIDDFKRREAMARYEREYFIRSAFDRYRRMFECSWILTSPNTIPKRLREAALGELSVLELRQLRDIFIHNWARPENDT